MGTAYEASFTCSVQVVILGSRIQLTQPHPSQQITLSKWTVLKKNKTGLLIRLTLCSALFCLHIQLGISQAGTENAAQFVFFVFPKLGLYAPLKAQIPLIPIACWFGLSAVWVFPGQKDRERETEKKIRPDITVMCHIILQGTGCFSRFLFSTFNALLVTAVQRAALWLQHTKPSHSRKCSVTENWHVSLLETILKISSQKLLCPKSQLLVYKFFFWLDQYLTSKIKVWLNLITIYYSVSDANPLVKSQSKPWTELLHRWHFETANFYIATETRQALLSFFDSNGCRNTTKWFYSIQPELKLDWDHKIIKTGHKIRTWFNCFNCCTALCELYIKKLY